MVCTAKWKCTMLNSHLSTALGRSSDGEGALWKASLCLKSSIWLWWILSTCWPYRNHMTIIYVCGSHICVTFNNNKVKSLRLSFFLTPMDTGHLRLSVTGNHKQNTRVGYHSPSQGIFTAQDPVLVSLYWADSLPYDLTRKSFFKPFVWEQGYWLVVFSVWSWWWAKSPTRL